MPTTNTKTPLEKQFHQDMIDGSVELKTKYHYSPTYFLQMVHEHGGIGAVKRLLQTPDTQDGLTHLWEIQRLDMSCEAAVLNPKYASLFSAEEMREAKKRLKAMNYTPTYE